MSTTFTAVVVPTNSVWFRPTLWFETCFLRKIIVVAPALSILFANRTDTQRFLANAIFISELVQNPVERQ